MKIVAYRNELRDEWDAFVRSSRNGTFLLERGFMDYHADRFVDCSLLVYDDDTLRGVFGATWDEVSRTVTSHGGLTYGGLIYDADATTVDVLEMLQGIFYWYIDYLGARRVIYKAIPYIYSSCPAEEDRYAIFRAGGRLLSRSISSVVEMSSGLSMRKLRLRGAKRAIDNGLFIDRMSEGDWDSLRSYWELLTKVLKERHNVAPVHTFEEMRLLISRFPQNIKLFMVREEAEIVAGCIVFITDQVAHIQYISAGERGRECGALDLLFRHLINESFRSLRYLDFGISTEAGGSKLNEGLIFQKEGFGARGVCYDTYEILLERSVIDTMCGGEAGVGGKIAFYDLKAYNESYGNALVDAVSGVVRSGRYLQGPQVNAFETRFAEYIGSRHCIMCGNGMDALTIIFRALKRMRGWSDDAEVLVPANTFIATILAIKEAGLMPVLCEPRLDDYLLDADNLSDYLTERTVAVVAVHLYGRVCDMESINAFAAAHKLEVVEDAAQAHGAMYKGVRAGHLGIAAGFSFYPAKNLGSLGDSGCVVTDDDDLAALARMLGNYGSSEKYVHEIAGMNSRSDELQAAVLLVKLSRLDSDNCLRRKIAKAYDEGIDNPLVTKPLRADDEEQNVYYVYPVRTGYRQQLMKWLESQGVQTIIHYPIPPHKQGALSEYEDLRLPVTEQIHREILSLPISPLLTDDEVARIIEAINTFNPSDDTES